MVREICDRHGVLMIADEVMCGTGRCGTWRALEHDGVTPDVMAIAKGLGGGYVPLGATLYHDKVAAVLDGVGGPLTGHTFTGHTLACAAGLAVQRIVERDQLVERVRADGPRLKQMIEDRFADVDRVGDIRGRGFFVGLELVADPATKEPFPAADGRPPARPPACTRQRTDLLPVGRQRRRRQRRHGDHRPAVQRDRRRDRRDRRQARPVRAGGAGRGDVTAAR